MAFNYKAAARKAAKALKANGITLQCYRPGSISRINGEEVSAPASYFAASGVLSEYTPYEVDGSRILAGDVKFVATCATDVKVGDIIKTDEGELRVIKPNPLKPNGLIILYQMQLRG